MRRQERELSVFKTLEIIENNNWGILSVVDSDGLPYGIPLSYCFFDKAIYFHCAIEGKKTDALTVNPEVSFCITGRTEVLPEKFSMKYESSIIKGTAEEVFKEEKEKALLNLIIKFSSDHIEKGKQYIQKAKERTRVFRINIEKFTGKSNTGDLS